MNRLELTNLFVVFFYVFLKFRVRKSDRLKEASPIFFKLVDEMFLLISGFLFSFSVDSAQSFSDGFSQRFLQFSRYHYYF